MHFYSYISQLFIMALGEEKSSLAKVEKYWEEDDFKSSRAEASADYLPDTPSILWSKDFKSMI